MCVPLHAVESRADAIENPPATAAVHVNLVAEETKGVLSTHASLPTKQMFALALEGQEPPYPGALHLTKCNIDQYKLLCDSINDKYELVDGLLVWREAPDSEHLEIQGFLNLKILEALGSKKFRFDVHVEARDSFDAKSCKPLGDHDSASSANEDNNIRFADITIGDYLDEDIKKDLSPNAKKNPFATIKILPWAVIEITSTPWNRSNDIESKWKQYAKFGIPEYYIVDRKEECVIRGYFGTGTAYFSGKRDKSEPVPEDERGHQRFYCMDVFTSEQVIEGTYLGKLGMKVSDVLNPESAFNFVVRLMLQQELEMSEALKERDLCSKKYEGMVGVVRNLARDLETELKTRKAAEAEQKVAEQNAAEAEQKAIAAEQKATEAEQTAVEAEHKATEAEQTAAEAEQKATEAEQTAAEAVQKATEAEKTAAKAEQTASEAEQAARNQARDLEAEVKVRKAAEEAQRTAERKAVQAEQTAAEEVQIAAAAEQKATEAEQTARNMERGLDAQLTMRKAAEAKQRASEQKATEAAQTARKLERDLDAQRKLRMAAEAEQRASEQKAGEEELNVAEAEHKAAEAERKASEAEQKAAEAEQKAAEAERRAAEAEQKASEEELIAAEAEHKAAEEELNAAEAEQKATKAERKAVEAEHKAAEAVRKAAEAEQKAVEIELKAVEKEFNATEEELKATVEELNKQTRKRKAVRAQLVTLQQQTADFCNTIESGQRDMSQRKVGKRRKGSKS